MSKSIYGRYCLASLVLTIFIVSFLSVPLLFFLQSVRAEPVLKPGWLYYRSITINHTLVGSGGLVNFPVLIDITDANLSSHAQADGDDIYFSDVNGVQLSHEIESYSAGHLVAWVKANLSSAVDTTLYMYYGNATSTNQEDPSSVWDSNFMMVQHLSETSGMHFDSSSNGNNGSPQGGVVQGTSGKIDGSDDFDGTDDYVTVPHSSTITGFTQSFTVEAWVKFDSTSRRQGILTKWNSAGNQRGWLLEYHNTNRLGFFVSQNGIAYPYYYATGFVPTVGTWYNIAVVWQSGQPAVFYVNGAQIASTSYGTPATVTSVYNNNGAPLDIGRCTYDISRNFDGSIDEVRISNPARSAQWISTCYNNQVNPLSFCTVGPEVPLGTPIVSDPYPSDGQINVNISAFPLIFNLTHPDGRLMDYYVTTNPPIGSDSDTGVGNGAYGVWVNGLTYNTTYTWHVNVTDGVSWTNKTYIFTTTTAPKPPEVKKDPYPLDGATGVSISISELAVMVSDPNGDLMNVTGTTSPDIGFSEGINIPDTPFTIPVSDLAPGTTYTWRVNVTDGTFWTNVTYHFTTGSALKFKTLMINHSLVGADLVNFPVLIDLTDSSLRDYAQPDGSDIYFTDINGLQLQHEIESYSTSNGHLVAWVKVPSLSTSVDTKLRMYYGDPEAGDPQNPSGVWDSNFMMVQHLDETSGTHYDSTTNGNNGTPMNALNQNAAGKIDGADDFDGTNDYITIPHSSTITGFSQAFTASFWIKMDSVTGRRTFLNKWNTGTGQRAWYFDYDSSRGTNALGLFVSADGSAYSYWYAAFSPVAGNWYYIEVVWRSGQQPLFYINGANVNATTATARASIYNNAEPLYIGGSYTSGRYFDGVIDEVRLSNVARSAQWISTCYNNQMNPSAFVSVSEPSPPEVVGHVPGENETGVPITTTIQVTFSETMNHDATEDAFSLNPGDLQGSPIWSDGDKVMTFDPALVLAYETEYTVTITTGAKDQEGETMLSPYNYSFTTEAPPEGGTPPYVIQTTPSWNATDVARDTTIRVYFNQTMDRASAENSFSISPLVLGNRTVSWTSSGGFTDARMQIAFDSKLNYSTVYTCTISTEALDIDDEHMLTPYVWNFTTQAPSPPYVVPPPIPAPGEKDVNYTTWAVNFSEPMDADSVKAALSINATGTIQSGWINSSYMSFFFPAVTSYMGYNVTVSTAAMDEQEENMTSKYSWTFTTGNITSQLYNLSWYHSVGSGYGSGESSPLIADLVSSSPGEEIIYVGGNASAGTGAGYTPVGRVFCLSGVDGHEIWHYTDSSIGWNVQPQMGDINNDGKYEIVVPCYSPTAILVLKSDGTLYWKRTGIGGSSYTSKPLLVDPDGDGLWMIFCAPEDVRGYGYPNGPVNPGTITYTGRIWAFNYDGREMKNGLQGTAGGSRSTTGGVNGNYYQWFAWRPCSGGFVMADTDNDGTFELFQNDRDMYYGDGDYAKGTICWEWNTTSQSLNLKWYQPDMLVSSHTPILVDVNKDGQLEVVAANMRGGLAIFNASTGAEIKKDYNIGLPSHYQPVVYDIDRDGNPEILLADGDHPGNSPPDIVVFDLTLWKIDARMYVGPCKFPPTVGEVTGDGIMDIIAVSDTGVFIFDGSHNPSVDHTYPVTAVATGTPLVYQCMYAVVQDIDNDGFNEIVLQSSGYRVYAFNTPAPKTTPRPRSEVQYYNERRTGVAEYVQPVFYDRTAPILSNPYPSNEAANVPVNLQRLNFTLADLQGDKMNCTVTTNFSVDTADLTGLNVSSGTYFVDVTDTLGYHTKYTWTVRATDGVHWNNKTYIFTTPDGTPPGSAPTHSVPLLNSTGTGEYENATSVNLVCTNQTTADLDGDKVTNIYRWLRNNQSIANLILPFDTDNLTTAKDYSGYNNNAQIHGATWTSNGKVGGAYSFDGLDDYMVISDGGAGYYNGRIYSSSLGGGGNSGNWSELTVEMWINLAALSTKESTRILMKLPSYEIGLGSVGGSSSSKTSSRLTAGVYLDNPASGDNAGPPNSSPKATEYWSVTAPTSMPLSINTWYHVAFTYKDGGGVVNSVLTLYINGVAVTASSSLTTRGPIKASSGEPLYIGWFDYFKGMIDEVRIYSRCLSTDQISQRYNETKNGITSSSTLTQTETKTGETWTCQVTPNDSHQDGTARTSNPLLILPGPQVPPVASNVRVIGQTTLSTSRVWSNETIVPIYSYSDVNDDPEVFGGSFGTEIRWYRNGTYMPTYDNLTNLSTSITNAHEDWTCQIKPGDGHTVAADWVNATNKVTVNSPPVVTSYSPQYGATQSSLTLFVGDNQTFSLNYTDYDGDPVTIQWQVDGVTVAENVTSYTYTVTATGSFTVRARLTDTGYGSATTTQSWNIVVR